MSTTPISHTFTISCTICGGHSEGENPCAVCHGEGVILLAGTPKDYMDCANCAGTGFVGFKVEQVCPVCNGVGAIANPCKRAHAKNGSR